MLMTQSIIEKATEFSRDFEVDPNKGSHETTLERTIDFLHEEVQETMDAIKCNDPAEIIDGFGDVAFIALNGIYKHFRLAEQTHEQAKEAVMEVMHRICDANLGKKQPDGTINYVNGKVQKPSGWTPPAYDDMVA